MAGRNWGVDSVRRVVEVGACKGVKRVTPDFSILQADFGNRFCSLNNSQSSIFHLLHRGHNDSPCPFVGV